MKLLIHYLKPYKGLVFLTLFLAGINMGFSLMDPILFGKLVNLANEFQTGYNTPQQMSNDSFFWVYENAQQNGKEFLKLGVGWIILLSITVAMISRIAKNFQDYFLNVVIQKFGAKVFTDGLQHAMQLPYQEFEDQRSGETLIILNNVRTDDENFIN